MFFFLLLPRSPLSSRESQEILGLGAHRGRNGVRHTPAVAPKPPVLLHAPPAHLSHPHINSELPPPPIPRTSRTGASTATSTWRQQCCTAFAGCCCCFELSVSSITLSLWMKCLDRMVANFSNSLTSFETPSPRRFEVSFVVETSLVPNGVTKISDEVTLRLKTFSSLTPFDVPTIGVDSRRR